MAFSLTEGGSITTFTNPIPGDEQFNVDELDIQEQVGCKFDEITDVVVIRKDELDDGHQLPDHSGVGEEEIPVVGISFGYRESRVNAATRANRITATRCKARMYVVLDNENECWVVSRLELRHSHPCSAEKAVHYHEYRELTLQAKCVITDNDDAGIRPNKTYLALANEGVMNYFVRMKEINPNFFYAIDVDDANKFRSALWVDARCRASYEYFGDVVSFDTTYRRNRHGLPFASFVGVNHHGKSTLVGCALLGSEKIPSFEWVFTPWARCVGSHIMKKSQFKIGGYARYGELHAVMNHIVWNSPSTESFESNWDGFIKQFKLGQNRWLAGMRSTQRSESMHAFYGGYLHCKSGLVQFVHEYDNVLGTKEQKELEDDAADSKGVIPCIGSTGIERQFQQEYTSSMFRILQLEGRKKIDCVVRSIEQKGDTISITVDEQKGQCECNKFESAGILCCHTLAVWSYYRVDIVPSCYVLPRWSKNVIREHTYVKSSHDVAQSDKSNNLFRHLCSEFYNVAQEFVACDEEATILRAALWDAKSKLIDYRASMRSTTAVASQNTVPTQSTGSAIVHDIQGPSRVKTKGRPKGKRLGAELDKSIKKSMQKRNRKSHLMRLTFRQIIIIMGLLVKDLRILLCGTHWKVANSCTC
ncbi:protein FAR1-RELATED SEQUENCE 9-like [Arachis hypogaea]|uniref:protein FAR1-RELATED SEQUENCE 9-like n=1 Tax=Arachis hypogaea TaxID=3818 RepID=UPI000DEC9B61|nr:protein FAR1-RELATED SEQUENCE 9-like [Arachis hypogaea]